MRVLTAVLVASLLGACSTKAKLIGQGGECLQATDCADGLVCVPQKDGKRLCDNDLSGVQVTEDASGPAPVDAGRRDAAAGDAEPGDATPPDDAGDDTGSGDAASE